MEKNTQWTSQVQLVTIIVYSMKQDMKWGMGQAPFLWFTHESWQASFFFFNTWGAGINKMGKKSFFNALKYQYQQGTWGSADQMNPSFHSAAELQYQQDEIKHVLSIWYSVLEAQAACKCRCSPVHASRLQCPTSRFCGHHVHVVMVAMGSVIPALDFLKWAWKTTWRFAGKRHTIIGAEGNVQPAPAGQGKASY